MLFPSILLGVGETLAPALAACLEHASPGLGRHPLAKPVGSLPSDPARIVGKAHWTLPAPSGGVVFSFFRRIGPAVSLTRHGPVKSRSRAAFVRAWRPPEREGLREACVTPLVGCVFRADFSFWGVSLCFALVSQGPRCLSLLVDFSRAPPLTERQPKIHNPRSSNEIREITPGGKVARISWKNTCQFASGHGVIPFSTDVDK
jgi:hypothetical protein